MNGKWTIHNSIAGNDQKRNCTFAQKDEELTGESKSDLGVVKITGKVDDKTVTRKYDSECNGAPPIVNYEGKHDGDEIAEEVKVDPFGVSGEFTATRGR